MGFIEEGNYQNCVYQKTNSTFYNNGYWKRNKGYFLHH